MKKALLITNLSWVMVVLLGVGYIYGCNGNKRATLDSGVSCVDCSRDSFDDLTKGDIDNAVQRYHENQGAASNSALNIKFGSGSRFQDANSCWYSLDTLKHFICLIEKYSNALGFSSDSLGIRFYYATYDSTKWYDPNGDKTKFGSNDYGFHHTLFMVPTYKPYHRTIDVDFDPRLTLRKVFPPGTSDAEILQKHVDRKMIETVGSITSLHDTGVPTTTRIMALGNIDQSNGAGGHNQGKLCPPTCD